MCHPRNPSPEIAKAGKPVAVSGHVIRVVAHIGRCCRHRAPTFGLGDPSASSVFISMPMAYRHRQEASWPLWYLWLIVVSSAPMRASRKV